MEKCLNSDRKRPWLRGAEAVRVDNTEATPLGQNILFGSVCKVLYRRENFPEIAQSMESPSQLASVAA